MYVCKKNPMLNLILYCGCFLLLQMPAGWPLPVDLPPTHPLQHKQMKDMLSVTHCCILLYYLKLIWTYQQFVSVSRVRGIERQVNLELLTIHSHAISRIQCLILLLWSQLSVLAPLWLLYLQTCSSSSSRSLLIQASICSSSIILSCFPSTPSSGCDPRAGIILTVH